NAELAIDAGSPGEADEARHLRSGRRHVGRDVESLGLRQPVPALVDVTSREMRVHRTAGGRRIVLGIGVKLREELLKRRRADRKHERLVAVVTGAPVPFAERPGPGELRDLFAVTEDPELRLAGEDFLPPDQARMAAANSH